MNEPNIPYATIRKFIKKRARSDLYFPESSIKALREISRAFIQKIVDEVVIKCQQKHSSIVTLNVIYETFEKIGLDFMIQSLKSIDQTIKRQKMAKKKQKEIIRRNIEKMYNTNPSSKQTPEEREKNQKEIDLFQFRRKLEPIVIQDSDEQNFQQFIQQGESESQPKEN